ncbi:1-phosphofructokinase family hexose kinase [Streptomyces sp. HB2AG]|uniref:1-phosphofructokinase family hexose kinase n=1 Tax=Streptomyces sp. HB2AG TaxID=2983400 RepID=UPI0022A9F826|nr:PfkB family carbohydrate kinase [Streptomyces sp. HB2AG]MCZ2523660.1 PfkB family carbohydrate kinase [Streptomyces sp. HB2AG]
MILTVTLDTVLDVTHRLGGPLVPGAVHRVPEVVERPWGGGLGAARVLAALGRPVTALGFAGGTTGELLRRHLAGAEGPLTDALLPVGGATRRTVTVVEPDGGATVLDGPGPTVTPAEWAALLDAYRDLLEEAEAVALCGGLPRGLPVGSYADLVREARGRGVPVLLGSGGEALRRGVAARPDVLAPGRGELARLTGSTEPEPAAQDARRRGARAVVVPAGAGRMLAVTAEGSWCASVTGRPAAGAVPPADGPAGAGDGVVAGLLAGLADGLDWPGRLAGALALSAASAAAGTGRGARARALPEVDVRPCPH